MKYFFSTTVVFFLTVFQVFAQNMVILENNRDLVFSFKHNRLVIEEDNHISKQFLKNFHNVTEENIYYSSFNRLMSFDAFTKVPTKKGKYKIQKVEVFDMKDIVQSGIFYGGHKKVEFIYPSVTTNSIGVLKYKKLITDPHIIESFFFDDLYPIKKSTYTVTFPSSVKIDYTLFNTEDYDVDFNTFTIGDNIKYQWQIRELPHATIFQKSPSRLYTSPHIIIRLVSYKINNNEYNIAGDVDDLFLWYNDLIKRIPDDKNKEDLQRKVQYLISGTKNKQEVIEAIYQWVQSNIKYIAFENGMAGFIPRSAGDVFHKKYGDCKDMANLLTEMLKLADIPAYICWVGTNSKPYSYEEVPCTITDNHMIAAVKMDSTYQFLDPTNSYLQYGHIPMLLQNKEALIRINDFEYDVVKIPTTYPTDNFRHDKIYLELEEEILKGDVDVDLTGYHQEKYQYAQIIAQIKNKENFLYDFIKIGRQNSSYEKHKETYSIDSLKLSLHARFKDEIIKINDKIYLNLNLDPSVEDFKIQGLKSRKTSVQEDFKHAYTYQCVFQIPDNYQVDFLPENTHKKFEFFDFSTEYQVVNNQIVLTKHITSNFLLLEEEYFNEYESFYEELLKAKNQKITLIKL